MAKEGVSKLGSSVGGSTEGHSSHHKSGTPPIMVEPVDTSAEILNRTCKHGRLYCPCFDGENFVGWLMKLEQFFKAEKV